MRTPWILLKLSKMIEINLVITNINKAKHGTTYLRSYKRSKDRIFTNNFKTFNLTLVLAAIAARYVYNQGKYK